MNSFRVILTELSDDDIAVYRDWFLESEPKTMTCRPIGDTSLDKMIERFRDRFNGETCGHFAVRRVDDNRLVGRASYFDLNTRNRSVEIGYLIGPEFRGKGYAREAIILMLRYLFDKLELNKAMAQTAEFNIESVALLKRLGFKQDGRLRQHHPLDGKNYDDLLFSILAEEFGSENRSVDWKNDPNSG